MIGLVRAGEGAAWRAALDGLPGAFGHQPGFVEAAAAALDRVPLLWHVDDAGARAACPVLLRQDDAGVDIVTPIGFAGFIANAQAASAPERIARAWTEDWRGRGVLAAYAQCAPWIGPAIERGWPDAAAWCDGPDCLRWDLRPTEDQLLAAMSSKHRQLLRKWLREEARPEHDQAALREAFHRLYPAFADRAGIGAAYRFDAAAIDALAAAPGALFVGARGADGGIEAVTLFGASETRGDSVLNAATPAGRRHSRGLYWLGGLALRARGVESMVLGGGIAAGDGLGEFKQRLGAAATPTRVLRQVFDAARFADACARHGCDPASRYFPPWRAPGP